MSAVHRNLGLGFVAVLAFGVAAGAWLLVKAPPPSKLPLPLPAPSIPESEPPPASAQRDDLEKATAEAPAATTVVFPLKVDLELLASDARPSAEGVAAMGSDATARLSGSVHGSTGEGLQTEIVFVAGPNKDRRLVSGRDGAFGANDLYPGLSIVRITSPGTPGSMREILLRQGQARETRLNVGFGRLAVVQGRVQDAAARPITDATVTLDGQETKTDEGGEFTFGGVAGGDTFLIAEKPGFAAHLERLTVMAGTTLSKDKLVLVLQPAARLEVSIEERINVENKASLFVLPAALGTQRDFPWYRVNPVSIYPGGSLVIEDLPQGEVLLRLFHSGADALPPTRGVTLREKETEHVVLHLAPAPVVIGTVTQDGKPVASATVVLEAPARSDAALTVIGQTNYLELEREVLPEFPAAVQRTTTNGSGEFVLNASESASRVRYLHASSPDGKSTAWKVLKGGEKKVDLALQPAKGDCELILRMDGRTQGLPVEITVDGGPREAQVLPPGRDLHVAGLAPGSWRLTVRWSGQPLVDGMILDMRKETSLDVTLPEGAIKGQDEDTRKRSGK
jgi:hypothetical protein